MSTLAILGFALSRIPRLCKTIIYHCIGCSPTAYLWDLRTAVVVTMLRDFLANAPPSTISQQQSMFLKDPGVKGPMWASKITLPVGEDEGVVDAVCDAVRTMGDGTEVFIRPELLPVTGEWIGHRAGALSSEGEPKDMSEADKYRRLTAETKSDMVLLYFHGGSNYLMDPVSTRPVAAKYATTAGCRLVSIRYRLAPQSSFPAALVDAFVSYLSLLYPAEDAFHEAVPATKIVICGDSHGGNISTSLLQFLLQLHRQAAQAPTVSFRGVQVPVPLPGGAALNSPSLDLTRSLHWSGKFAEYDYLPPPSWVPAQSPPCELWPTKPPRVDLWCDGSMLAHPLISPLGAKSWAGSPPIFMVCGEEMLTDECRFVAQKAASQGVRVVWEQYQAMPHCFALFLSWAPAADLSYTGWLNFIRSIDEGQAAAVSAKGAYIAAPSLTRTPVDLPTLSDMTDEQVAEEMEKAKARLQERFAYLLKQ